MVLTKRLHIAHIVFTWCLHCAYMVPQRCSHIVYRSYYMVLTFCLRGVCIYVYMYTRTYVYMYMCIYVYMHMYMCIFKHIYIYRNIVLSWRLHSIPMLCNSHIGDLHQARQHECEVSFVPLEASPPSRRGFTYPLNPRRCLLNSLSSPKKPSIQKEYMS